MHYSRHRQTSVTYETTPTYALTND